jgi:hypothetical protein
VLHALLHGKLDEANPEPQRLEDALTSTLFGTLIIVEAWAVITAWFGLGPNDIASTARADAWFWPRLAFAEPDVVIRLGDYLVVVEAKYGSNRNDGEPECTEAEWKPHDQLFRQFRSVTTPLAERSLYAESLEEAIRRCHLVQIYAVDGRRRKKAEAECAQSKCNIPAEAVLRLATWQQLYSLLSVPSLETRRWAVDLRAYLERCGLDSFQGVGHHLEPAGASQRVLDWQPSIRLKRLDEVMMPPGSMRAIREWRAPATAMMSTRKWVAFQFPTMDARAGEAILAWRRSDGESR